MNYRLGADRAALLTLEVAENTEGQRILSDNLEIADATVTRIAGEAGVGQRVWAALATEEMRLSYTAQIEVTRGAVALESFDAAPIHALPPEALTFLRPSRLVQSDMFGPFVARRFAGLEGGAKVAAISDWVRRSMAYGAFGSTQATTALDTFAARQGVCRDFVHVVCALVRAANIPARYVAAYGPDVDPPDFHAVAQVWLGGAWQLVDATGLCAPETLAVIAVGRDAGDTAFMETTDAAQFLSQSVQVSRRPAPARP
ncbi:transglutaminase-like domain-containing protein [Roseicitreum antarcticum]|nr:transglutaminase domain-containing protein [Roseicitreum antarcticum]